MSSWHFQTLPTPWAGLTVVVDEVGAVRAAGFDELGRVLGRLPLANRPATLHPGCPAEVSDAVAAYVDGDLTALDDVAVTQTSTPLREQGWAELRRIAPGHPVTYAGLAARLGRPTAVRAAASICAQNRVALFVPCHRVVGSTGALTGYAWGVDIKRGLLAHEATAADDDTLPLGTTGDRATPRAQSVGVPAR